MLKISENNGTEEIGLVTPTPVPDVCSVYLSCIYQLPYNVSVHGLSFWKGIGQVTMDLLLYQISSRNVAG